MEELKKILNENIEKSWQVPSDTTDEIYTVRLYKDGKWTCSCPSTKECKHVKRMKYLLNGRTIRFEGYEPIVKLYKTINKVEINFSDDQWDNIKELPNLAKVKGMFEIIIRIKE